MSTQQLDRGAERRRRFVVYTAWGLLLVALLIVMLVMFDNRQTNKDATQAQAKADQLVAALQDAGLASLDADTVAQVLGTDGGAVCADPGSALTSALSRGTGNGAAGPGIRPSLLPPQAVAAERTVLTIYCPDRVADFDEYVDTLHRSPDTQYDVDGTADDA